MLVISLIEVYSEYNKNGFTIIERILLWLLGPSISVTFSFVCYAIIQKSLYRYKIDVLTMRKELQTLFYICLICFPIVIFAMIPVFFAEKVNETCQLLDYVIGVCVLFFHGKTHTN